MRAKLTPAYSNSLADPQTRAMLQQAGVDVLPEAPARYEERIVQELPMLRACLHKVGLSDQ